MTPQLSVPALALSALLIMLLPYHTAAQPGGAVPGRVVDAISDRQSDRARERARDLLQQQAESQAAERARQQASERAQQQLDQLRQRVQEQAQGRTATVAADRLEPARNRALQRSRDPTAFAAQRALERVPTLPLTRPDRANRAERTIVTDRDGRAAFVELQIDPFVRAVEAEWLLLVTAAQSERLQQEAPQLLAFITQRQSLLAINSELLTIRVPVDLDAGDAVLQLLPEDMRHLMDRNHVYSVQSDDADELAALASPMRAVCADAVRIGLIDAQIDTDHPAFAGMARRGTSIVGKSLVDQRLSQPAGHGTAVASILAGEGDGLQPLLPAADLYGAAVVYGENDAQSGSTALHMLQALDWLLLQDVRVINISLAGPANRLLEQGIMAALSAGVVMVAAAGNEGPHAPPQYPAAYAQVIGVTAVDADLAVYRWANQGDHVDFAAFGVAVTAALAGGDFGPVSGTSIAAPVVTAFVACAMAQQLSAGKVMAKLKSKAVDLGTPGRDPVFGYGLLHPGWHW